VSASFRVVVGRLVGLDSAKAMVLKVIINRDQKKDSPDNGKSRHKTGMWHYGIRDESYIIKTYFHTMLKLGFCV
jgi:hypothetical protein